MRCEELGVLAKIIGDADNAIRPRALVRYFRAYACMAYQCLPPFYFVIAGHFLMMPPAGPAHDAEFSAPIKSPMILRIASLVDAIYARESLLPQSKNARRDDLLFFSIFARLFHL